MDESRRTRKTAITFWLRNEWRTRAQQIENWRHLFLIGHGSVVVGQLLKGFLNNGSSPSTDEGVLRGINAIKYSKTLLYLSDLMIFKPSYRVGQGQYMAFLKQYA
ncbi:hypothetical protein MRB53_016407 [Persea americana]|uniref:Uncharacterized protein n=1 Tax=Persea americana TaxID=3435 RepID=A0ACC2M226_PERAE|nr:hypothetical protein MRB53_016407 [Persea americana]